MTLRVAVLVLPIVVAGCSVSDEAEFVPPTSSTASVSAFATELLDGLQSRSINGNREYCGYIVRNSDGTLSSTRVNRGRQTSCDLPPVGSSVIASFHTHAAYNPDYNNEIPSSQDLITDFEDGIDGYVSTPAGRIWRVDHRRRVAVQVCGVRCVTADPEAFDAPTERIASRYTLAAIRELED